MGLLFTSLWELESSSIQPGKLDVSPELRILFEAATDMLHRVVASSELTNSTFTIPPNHLSTRCLDRESMRQAEPYILLQPDRRSHKAAQSHNPSPHVRKCPSYIKHSSYAKFAVELRR